MFMRSAASVEEKIRKGREGIIGGKTGAKAMQDNLRKTVLAVVSKGKAENFGVQLVTASCKQGACNAISSICCFFEGSQIQNVKTTEAVQNPVFVNNIHKIVFTSLRRAYRLSQP